MKTDFVGLSNQNKEKEFYAKAKRFVDICEDDKRLGFIVRCWILEDLAVEAMQQIEKDGRIF